MVSYRGDKVVLDSGKLRIEFDPQHEPFRLVSLKGPNGLEWAEQVDGAFWRLALAGPDGTAVEYGSDDAGLIGIAVSEDNNGVQFAWEVDSPETRIEVEMDVRVEKDSPISHWAMRVDLPRDWNVTRADFPMLPNIRRSDSLKLCAPEGWGLEYEVGPETVYDGSYPSCCAGMQFMAFYGGGNGLYIGAHDTQGNHKSLSARGGEKNASCKFTNWPGIPEDNNELYEVPFEAAIGVFEGGYYEAAQIYREFTFTAPWSKAGPVSKRPIPQWLKDTDLWLKPDENPLTAVETATKAKEFFDANISLHWYRWHQIPYDTLYPEYFPPKPGFVEGIKGLQDAGFHVMPYINGRLCDKNSTTWKDEGGSEWAARKEDGESYTEVYGSKVPLEVMCPYTPQWQSKIAGLVGRLVKECGVNGVYIDQIGAAAPYKCYNSGHGHPLGSGHMWVDGYRKLLEQARENVGEGRILTTEENAECWIDQFDAFLPVNTHTSDKFKIIPLYPSVYSGRAITYGVLYIVPDDIPLKIPFRMKMAQAFVWGSQLGWVDVYRIMDPEAVETAEFLKNLARCRRYGHQFVTTGRFLGMVDAVGDNPHVNCIATGTFGGNYTIDMPSVIASAWEAEDGSIGVTIANMGNEDHQVEITAPLKAGKDYVMEAFGPDGKLSEITTSSAKQQVMVPARSAVILSFK